MTDYRRRRTAGDLTASVTSMLRHWAAAQPDAPMLTLGDDTVTWGELYERAIAGGRRPGRRRRGTR